MITFADPAGLAFAMKGSTVVIDFIKNILLNTYKYPWTYIEINKFEFDMWLLNNERAEKGVEN